MNSLLAEKRKSKTMRRFKYYPISVMIVILCGLIGFMFFKLLRPETGFLLAEGKNVTSASIHPNGDFLAVAGAIAGEHYCDISIWNLEQRILVSIFYLCDNLTESFYGVSTIEYSPDGNYLLIIIGSEPTQATIISAETGEIDAVFISQSPITDLQWSLDGTKIASANDDGTITLWDVESGQVIHTFTGHTQAARSVAFHPHSSKLVSAGEDETIRVWDISSKTEILRIAQNHDFVMSARYSSDGSTILSASYDGTVSEWNSATGQELARYDVQGRVFDAVYTANSRYVISAEWFKSEISIWDRGTRQPIEIIHHKESKYLNLQFIVFDEKRQQIISGAGGQIKIWNIEL